MVKGIILGFVAALFVTGFAAYLVAASGAIPANADARPGALETWVAETALAATLGSQAPKGPNPVVLTDANLAAGMRLYAQYCAVCHGAAGGERSPSWIARGEYPPPPQLASDGVEDDPEGWTFWKIAHGIRLTGMPSWRAALTDTQIWTLVLFLKHMDTLPPTVEAAWKALPPPR